jgi:hypothetical protein
MSHEVAMNIAFWVIVTGTSTVVLAFIIAVILLLCNDHNKNKKSKTPPNDFQI